MVYSLFSGLVGYFLVHRLDRLIDVILVQNERRSL